MTSGSTPQATLVALLARMAQLHAARRADRALLRALERLAFWQASRMSATYADLAGEPRYTAAIAFFLSDLYGSADFAQRDADLARIVPVLTRMLPARVIATIADATELNVISQELDRGLLARLPRADGTFTVAQYCMAYRWPDDRQARERQIGLIGQIGAGLDDYVRKPMIRSALAVMRRPARLGGLATLHDFLERGFIAFERMKGAGEFLATIDRRERELMAALYAGVNAPFAEPVSPQRIAEIGPAGPGEG